MIRIYNVLCDRLDPSLLKIKPIARAATLPASVDLRPGCPPVYDQGDLGSCTANALCACYEFEDLKDDEIGFAPSRLFVYYNERKLERSIKEDSGAALSDGIATLQKYGVCPESLWPYDVSKFAKKPSSTCYKTALRSRALDVSNIAQDAVSMKNSLFATNPFVVGISVYESFESDTAAKTMPNVKTEKLLGGHAVLCVGYDDVANHWIMRNSWGASWGDNGYFYLPYDYLLSTSLTSDLWNIRRVSASLKTTK